jgi:hypothetical protein
MHKVDFKEPATAEWLDWKERAEAECERICDLARRYRSFEIDEDLYKEMKAVFLAVFHGKCAYCETDITAGQRGDVEHYRPKQRVMGEDGKPLKVKGRRGKEIQHQGYYWLAYDWRNLLLACILCNQPSKGGKREVGSVPSQKGQLPGDQARGRSARATAVTQPC